MVNRGTRLGRYVENNGEAAVGAFMSRCMSIDDLMNKIKHTFYHVRESGGTKISSAYELCHQIIDARFAADQWNIYAFHFSDGDNWGDDSPKCVDLLNEKLLPKLNLFGYGQVESPYGSGEFFEYINELAGEKENVIASRVPDREAILGSIKEFLGTANLRLRVGACGATSTTCVPKRSGRMRPGRNRGRTAPLQPEEVQ
jgi:Protein of unknown function (DUF444)